MACHLPGCVASLWRTAHGRGHVPSAGAACLPLPRSHSHRPSKRPRAPTRPAGRVRDVPRAPTGHRGRAARDHRRKRRRPRQEHRARGTRGAVRQRGNVAGSIPASTSPARTSRAPVSSGGRRCRPVLPPGAGITVARAMAQRGQRRRCSARCSNSTVVPPAPIRDTCSPARSTGSRPRGSRRSWRWSSSSTCSSGTIMGACVLHADWSPAKGSTSMPMASGGSTTCRRCSTSCIPRPVRRDSRCAR